MTKHDRAALDNPICLRLGYEFKVKPFLIETKERTLTRTVKQIPTL